MNTMATFCNCPFDGMYGHLPVCPTFAPTQSEASEPAEGAFKLPEGFKFPEGWGTIENSEKMPDGSFMDYVSVPKGQYDALVQRLEQAEKREIDRSAILVMIRAARDGDMKKFQSYAEFVAEKTGDERFIASVKRYFAGDYGNTVTAQGTTVSE